MNAHINKKVKFIDLGLISYQQAWDYQTNIFNQIVTQKIENRGLSAEEQLSTTNVVIACEHPHVYTLGKSGKKDHLLITEKELQTKGVEYFHINRGGDITYHGPGQVIFYPILDLDHFFTDIHRYLRLLEETVILALQDFGIRAGRIEGLTGVWLDFEEKINPRKICAFGVKMSRWVTMHGLALNVNTDLSFFNQIVPCGISDKAVTSMQTETGKEIPMDEVKGRLLNHFQILFNAVLI